MKVATLSQRQRMIKGLDFFSSDPELIKDKQEAHEFYTEFNQSFRELYNAEKEVKKIFGRVGVGIKVVPPLYFSYGYQVFLGDNVHINVGVFLGDAGKIVIGERTLIGPYVQIYTTNHDSVVSKRGYIKPRDVEIGEDVWIGGGVIILPGVKIGRGSIIGAGSVVTKDIPENVVAYGAPAKVTRSVLDEKAA